MALCLFLRYADICHVKNKENADDLLQKKKDLEEQKKKQEELAVEKEVALWKKAKTVGNYVHESVPVSDNEV